jgi:carbon starvation protein CstA
MWLFLLGIAVLIAGYFTYGKFVEHVIQVDDRETPAITMQDGVDYLTLPKWKNMLIQLLNIAGVGPVIGVILGIKFGAIVFVLIPIGNLIAGATHDFLAGMMSIRSKGANLPVIVKNNLGKTYYSVFSFFMCFLLLLVVAVFINIPANLFKGLNLISGDGNTIFWGAVAVIFVYYIAATMFPIDKIIGSVYPFFGGLLILSSVAIFGVMLIKGFQNPALFTESVAFKQLMFTAEKNQPIIPCLFVTIACGIISGFHATQSPIIARTMKSEREARASFYGMMVLEGLIGMIWAGAGIMIYNMYPELMAINPNSVLVRITTEFLGSAMGKITIAGVIVLAITSGDTAMRSLRLSLSEIFKIEQKSLWKRFAICLPLIVIISALLYWSNKDAKSFGILWNYFSWGNQILAMTTLLAGSVWLQRQNKLYWIALLPAMFMTFIVFCYILWVDKSKSGPIGFGFDLTTAYILSGILTLITAIMVYFQGKNRKSLEKTEI